MFTQVESQLTVKYVYDRWRPQIVHDLHQMGARAARIFAPPYVDPWEPNVDPALRSAVNGLGSFIAGRLASEGKKGVVIAAIYDGWTPARAYPHTHGGVRILTECASARMATPIEVKFEDLDDGDRLRRQAATSWNFPDPWPGGTWRLRDIVDYQISATRALLQHAARNRDYWLRTFFEVNRRAATRREPYAFVVPGDPEGPAGHGPAAGGDAHGAVEVHRARAPFEAAGRRFPAGSHVILMAQPFSAFAKSLLERQHYPGPAAVAGRAAAAAVRRHRPHPAPAHGRRGGDGRSAFRRRPRAGRRDRHPARAASSGDAGASSPSATRTRELVALGRLLRAGRPRAVGDGGLPRPGPERSAPARCSCPRTRRARLEPLARELGFVAVAAQRARSEPAAAQAPRRPLPVVGPLDGRGLDALRLREAARRRLRDAPRQGRPRGRPARALRRDRPARPGRGGRS